MTTMMAPRHSNFVGAILLLSATTCDGFVCPVRQCGTSAPRFSDAPRLTIPHPSSLNVQSMTDRSSRNGKSAIVAPIVAPIPTSTVLARTTSVEYQNIIKERSRKQWLTLLRVTVPSILTGIAAFAVFPALSLGLATLVNDAGVFAVLSQDSSQFVQNFLSVSSLLFSILVGQTYYFLYTQTESIYYALFSEVAEAKSLLEQVALVCQGRSMYGRCLDSIARYVKDDLKQIHADPAVLLSARPIDDPLEGIMYMTSVGVPSTVYETVRTLREARAQRLGALQRKLPSIHMGLLWILAAIELVSFPLLGAGTQTLGGYKTLTVEGVLFGVMTGGIVLTLRVVGELWRPAGGAYNVDSVLEVMVSGLEEELKARMAGIKVTGASSTMAPSAASDTKETRRETATSRPIQQQGGINVGYVISKVSNWIKAYREAKQRRRMDSES